MSPSFIHSSNPNLAIAAVGGRNYWLQAIWATDPGLLTEPPALPRTAANYLESPELWVGAEPTAASPAVIRAEPAWWHAARAGRTIWSRVSWRGKPADPWVFKAMVEFVVNHAPDAVVVPEQVVALDGAGAVIADVRLDGTASSDPDRTAATNPAGPLAFHWAAVEKPPGLAAGGAVANAAGALGAVADPLFLPAGTAVPASDRGAFGFRLTVDDGEPATIGQRAGQSRTATADARVIIGAPAGPGVTVVTPSTAQPYFGNFEDGVDAVIAYRIDPALTAQAAYANGWRLKCTITQAAQSTVAFSNPVGTTAYETFAVPRAGQVEFIRWDGRDPAAAGLPCVGAFDVRLELQDAAGASTGVAGAVATATRCIVLDYARWLVPVGAAVVQTARSGSFMESGHGGFAATDLHGGLDLVRRPVGQPDVQAARSGFYTLLGGATNAIEVRHAEPDRTRYLHGDTLAAHAAGDLVLQGDRLARMANAGTVGVHLHFEHRTGGGAVLENPQGIVALWDAFRPVIEAVYVRQASAAGVEARLTNAATGIAGQADLIVRCRDRSHPGHDSTADAAPYRLQVIEKPVAVAAWPQLRFDRMDAADHVRNYYEQRSHAGFAGTPADEFTHYLLYLRWDTAPYAQQGGHLWLDIVAGDYHGQVNVFRSLTIGPQATLAKAPAAPATASANPKTFTLEIDVTNQMKYLNDNPANSSSFLSVENFHIALAGAPAGWTVSPARTGAIGNGATAMQPWGGQPPAARLVLTIDPHGSAPAGTHAFSIVVSSDILRQVGVRVPVTAVIS